jgi:AAA15 family ATPase/GTPase
MIIEFTVGNFLSFNEKRTISFEAQGGVSELKDNYFTVGKVKFLRSLVLYGANSSGKSNLIKAIDRMKRCLFQSIESGAGVRCKNDPKDVCTLSSGDEIEDKDERD